MSIHKECWGTKMLWKLLSWWDRRKMDKAGGYYLNTKAIYGTYRCFHLSHRLKLHCYRSWTSDYYCGKHNGTCWSGCK